MNHGNITQDNPIMSRVFLLFAMLMVAFSISIATPVAAEAAQVPSATISAENNPKLCSSVGTDKGREVLPVFRWSGTTGDVHSRYSKLDLSGVMGGFTDRAITEVSFGFGNAMWNATTSMVTLANRACPIDAVGGIVDHYAGWLGEAIIESGIVAVFVAATIIGLAWRGYRNGGSMRAGTLMPKILVLGLLVAMINGAAQSKGGGWDGSDKAYVPGVGSPGWIATTIDSTVSALAQAPVAVMMESDTYSIGGLAASNTNIESASGNVKKYPDAEGWNTAGKSNYSNSCRYYLKALHDLYKEKNHKAKVDVTGTSRALSSMWEQSGLRAWRQVQFGNQSAAGPHMYCYALDQMAGIDILDENGKASYGTVANVMKKANMAIPATDDKGNFAPIYKRTSNTSARDRQFVALAQCRVTNSHKVASGAAKELKFDIYQLAKKDAPIPQVTETDCKNAFTPGKEMPAVFDWPAREGKGMWENARDLLPGGGGAVGVLAGKDPVEEYAIPGSKMDFLESLHSGSGGIGMLTGIFYMCSSFFVMVSFGLLSAAILLAKMAALVFLFTFIFVAVAYMLPNSDPAKFPRLLKQYTGLSFFIFGFQLIMAILAFLTKILVDLGSDTIDNAAMEMLWVGIAPALALIAMHLSFKKMGMPSPLSVNAGQAWGKAAGTGALGTAAIAGGSALGGGLLARKLGHTASSALGNQISDRWSAARGSKGVKEKDPNRSRPGAMTGKESTKPEAADEQTEMLESLENGTQDDVLGADDNFQQFAEADGKKASDMALEARREDWNSKTTAQKLATPFTNTWEDVKANLKDWRQHPVGGTFKRAAKTLPLLGVGAAATAAVVVGGTPLAAVAGLGATTFAAKKGISAVATRAGMNTKANRRAFEHNARRRAEAMKASAEAERAEAEQARMQQEAQDRADSETTSGDTTQPTDQQPSVKSADDVLSTIEDVLDENKALTQFIAAHRMGDSTVGPDVPHNSTPLI